MALVEIKKTFPSEMLINKTALQKCLIYVILVNSTPIYTYNNGQGIKIIIDATSIYFRNSDKKNLIRLPNSVCSPN